MILYEAVFRALNKGKVKYLIVGGVASILHGADRFTFDLDIVSDLTPSNIRKLFRTLDKIGYYPRVPVTVEDFSDPQKRKEWKAKKNMKAFSFVAAHPPFDIVDIVLEDGFPFEKISRNATRMVLFQNVSARVISRDDLLKMKLKAGRDKDQADIAFLKEVKKIERRGAK
ncbi:MAG: hypothetical protein HZC17_04585 [Candidatus Omnitrophica bacterium]|nr:hypothetical protein [Candidatus Omnitrophota bacterium]